MSDRLDPQGHTAESGECRWSIALTASDSERVRRAEIGGTRKNCRDGVDYVGEIAETFLRSDIIEEERSLSLVVVSLLDPSSGRSAIYGSSEVHRDQVSRELIMHGRPDYVTVLLSLRIPVASIKLRVRDGKGALNCNIITRKEQ